LKPTPQIKRRGEGRETPDEARIKVGDAVGRCNHPPPHPRPANAGGNPKLRKKKQRKIRESCKKGATVNNKSEKAQIEKPTPLNTRKR